MLLREDFGSGMNVFTTPPWLTVEGWLCVGFGQPYESLYVLETDAGLATNSPWPNPTGQMRLMRQLAPWLCGANTN